MNTKTRILRTKLSYWMFKKKVLIITGARQVGKTTLLEMLFSKDEALWLNGDDQALRIRLEQINSEGIRDLIGNHKIVIIDEVQRLLNTGLLLKMNYILKNPIMNWNKHYLFI